MTRAIPLRFSTKYQDDETDLLYYGYRYYNASTGRWLSRDPLEDSGSYHFVNNSGIGAWDVLGLWGEGVHFFATTRWASQLHMRFSAAHMIGYYDNGVDGDYDTFLFTDENWSWHFDRSATGQDSRIVHAQESMRAAELACTWSEGIQNDEWGRAAHELGQALHPLQDWMAHGDFNRRAEASHISSVPAWEKLSYAHNYHTPVAGQSYKTVDDPAFDSVGPYGRPTLAFMMLAGRTSHGDDLYWAWFLPGSARITRTATLTKRWLSSFQAYVRQNSKPCGQCRSYFLGD